MNIDKLKNKILQLAIQGKLVEQDENDESAEILYEKIQEEKEKLIKEKKIRKVKVDDIEEEDIPFEIPESWKWVRLGDITEFINGDRGKNYPNRNMFVDYGIPFINAGHLNNGDIIIEKMNYINQERFDLLSSGKVNLNDIIYCLRGTLGKLAINNNLETGAIASSLMIIRKIYGVEVKYLSFYLSSQLGEEMILKYDNGTAQPNLSGNNVRKYGFPLPPLNEQKRIVDKIDELFKIVDELNDEKEDILKLIERTRESVLTKAIQGKLVEQDENDESSEVIYEKIQEEKEQMIKNKKIKWSTVDTIEKDEAYYRIPDNWKWTKFGDICNIRRGASPRPIKNYITEALDGVNWIKIGDGNAGKYLKSTSQKITKEGANKSVFLEKGSLILSNSMSFGKPYILDIDGCIHDGWLSVQFNNKLIDKELLYYFLLASFAELEKKAYGTGVRNLNTDRVKNLLIPLPPLNEQKRIVEKIDKVMNCLDEIESSIRR